MEKPPTIPACRNALGDDACVLQGIGGTLTVCQILRIAHDELSKLIAEFPRLMEAFWRYTVWDATTTAEWLLNVGQRAGVERIANLLCARASVAHLLCEMAVRLDKVQGNSFSFSFPISQHQFSEVCGLSVVHINRSLMGLRRDGLVRIDKGVVRVGNWLELKNAAHFSNHYLPSALVGLAA